MATEDRLVVVTFNLTKIDRVVRWALVISAVICATAVVIATVKAMRGAYLPLPYWDQWGALTTGENLEMLFHQHNEHRLIAFKLISVLDNYFASGTYKVNFSVSLLLQILHAGLLIATAYCAGLKRIYEVLWATAIAFGYLFWAGQGENLFWGFQTQFFGVYACGTLAFVALAGLRSWIGVSAALLAAIAAVGFMSNGVLVPVLLPVLAIGLRRSWLQVGALTLVGVAVIACYLVGYQTPGGHGHPFRSLQNPEQILAYMLTYVGSPATVLLREAMAGKLAYPQTVAIAFGAAGLASTLCVVATLAVWRSLATPARLVLISVILFITATAFVTALGRVNFGLDQAMSSRYLTPALVFWVAFIFLLWSLLPSPLRLLVPVSATVSLLLMLQASDFVARETRAVRERRDGAATALLAGVRDEPEFEKVFPHPDFVAQRAEVLRKDRLAIFSLPWSDWMGKPLQSQVHIRSGFVCIGSVDQITPISASADGSGYRSTGWAWDIYDKAAPEWILLTDAQGLVVGYGLTDSYRPDVRVVIPAVRSNFTGWRGHLKMEHPGEVRAYALSSDARSACLIGTKTFP
ncbi:hypothetical protein ABLE91_19670 [Aquabacter sp. CN5-332]|uniref:hypothetical protein n=1 Tax=Aquabacter sp. CN5-332 TaxID=3156608 RepID=UPI0032B41978